MFRLHLLIYRNSLLYSSGEILESVARSLFTLTINEHTTPNVCLYLLKTLPVNVNIFSTKFESMEIGAVTQRINKSYFWHEL